MRCNSHPANPLISIFRTTYNEDGSDVEKQYNTSMPTTAEKLRSLSVVDGVGYGACSQREGSSAINTDKGTKV